jgi:hypothetical protein
VVLNLAKLRVVLLGNRTGDGVADTLGVLLIFRARVGRDVDRCGGFQLRLRLLRWLLLLRLLLLRWLLLRKRGGLLLRLGCGLLLRLLWLLRRRGGLLLRKRGGLLLRLGCGLLLRLLWLLLLLRWLLLRRRGGLLLRLGCGLLLRLLWLLRRRGGLLRRRGGLLRRRGGLLLRRRGGAHGDVRERIAVAGELLHDRGVLPLDPVVVCLQVRRRDSRHAALRAGAGAP